MNPKSTVVNNGYHYAKLCSMTGNMFGLKHKSSGFETATEHARVSSTKSGFGLQSSLNPSLDTSHCANFENPLNTNVNYTIRRSSFYPSAHKKANLY